MQIRSLDIHVNDRCNLRCRYCYLRQGDYVDRGEFPDELIDVLPEVCRRLGVRDITFYGGEPMLSFDILRRIVERLPGLRFGIVTNGTICTEEMAEFIHRHRIGVQRSIDGCPEVMEKTRPGAVERYIALTPRFRDYHRARRSTITPDTVCYMYQSWCWLRDQGFDDGWTPIPDFYAEWRPEQIQMFIEQLRQIGRDLVETVKRGGEPFYNYWFNRLAGVIRERRGERVRPSPRGCGAGVSLLALRQDGWFFACHRFVTDGITSPWCFGHVSDVLSGRGLRPGTEAARAIATARGLTAYGNTATGAIDRRPGVK